MFDHILVPLDGSPLAECVLPFLLPLAQAFHVRVTLLHVLERGPARGSIQALDLLEWDLRRVEAETYLQKISTRLREAGLQVETALEEGQAADGIIRYARYCNACLIALSSHGRSGLSGWNISSTVQKVIFRAHTSSLIVPAYQPVHLDLTDLRYQRVFVALDGSQRAEHVLPAAVKLSDYHRASLRLAHVVCRPGMPSHLPLTKVEIEMANRIVERNQCEAEKYLRQLCSRLSSDTIDVQACLLVSENPIEVLHELVERERADLVILSAHGHSSGCKWPYGSVTLSFIAYGTTPLLILQDLPPEQIAPTPAEMAAKEQPKH